MSEEWRPIPGYEGRYEVSSDGRVRSFTRWADGREVSPFLAHGYRRIRLRSADGRDSQHGVHRLVLMAFDRMPVGDEQARHLNDEKLDNRLENLAWGSQSDNMVDRVRNGKCPRASMTHCRNGHPLDAANTTLIPSANGRAHRKCRTCQRAIKARYNASRSHLRSECQLCGSSMHNDYLPVHMANLHADQKESAA